jgi:alpha-L-arabinofuranosidase
MHRVTLVPVLLLALLLHAAAPSITPLARAMARADTVITVDAGRPLGPVKQALGLTANELPDRLGRTIERVQALAPANGQRLNVRNFGTKVDGESGKEGWRWKQTLTNPNAWGGTPEAWVDYAAAVGGEWQALVNFGSATAQEAADLVAYLNGTDPNHPMVQLRQSRGRPEPFGVRMFEIGNEQYYSFETGAMERRGDPNTPDTRSFDYANPNAPSGGDPAWHGRPALFVQNYAARAAEFARAMRAASPSPIKLYAVLGNWDNFGWGRKEWGIYATMEQAVEALIAAGKHDFDGVVIHYYPQNSTYLGHDNVSVLGYPALFAQRLNEVRAALARFSPDKPMELVISEWNLQSTTISHQPRALVNGLFVADNLRLFLNDGIDVANYFAISEPGGQGSGFTLFDNGDVARPTPAYYALQLFTRTVGSTVLLSEVFNPPLATTIGNGRPGSVISYPALTATASLSADGDSLTLIVVNKDLTQDRTAALEILNFGYYPQAARVYELNGPSPDAMNDQDEQVSLREWTGEKGNLASGVYTFPAHSVTAIVLTRHPDAPDGVQPPVNLALGKPAGASSTAGADLPANVTDGTVFTRWVGPGGQQWLETDLFAPYDITRVVVRWGGLAARDYRLQVSPDYQTWVDVYAVSQGPGAITSVERIDLLARGRWVRLLMTAPSGGGGYAVAELEVYGREMSGPDPNTAFPTSPPPATPGPPAPPGQPATPAIAIVPPAGVTASDNTAPDHPAAAAADGNTQTTWETTFTSPAEAWLVFDLGAPRALAKLRWNAGTHRWTQSFQVQRSDDGQTWTTVDGAVNLGGGSGGGWREQPLSGTGRYVRLLFTNQPDSGRYKFAINEVEIYAGT